jgi:hypothetical protein
MLPLELLLEYLKRVDEVQLLELLNLTSEDLVDTFLDRIKERRKFLEGEVEQLPEPPEAGEGGTFYDDEDLFDGELENN